MKKIYSLLMVLLSSMNAENSGSDWSILNNGLGSIIEVYDRQKEYRVIKFSSLSNKDTYINGARKGEKAWNNQKSKTIQWSFKYRQNYVVIVTLLTIKGYKNLIYTANDKSFKSYIGLGSHTIKDNWVTITRNLEDDLHQQDPTNKIISVNGFAIRGDGLIDNVHMLDMVKLYVVKSLYHTIEEALLYLKNQKFVTNSLYRENSHIKNRDIQTLPTITLLNGKKIYLKVGTPFVDPGAIAKDAKGRPLEIEMIGNVNSTKVDEYHLHYLTIDNKGNATSVTRTIVVFSDKSKNIKKRQTFSKEINKTEKDNQPTEEEIYEADKEIIIDKNRAKNEVEEIMNLNLNSQRFEEEELKIKNKEAFDMLLSNTKGDTKEEKLENIAQKFEQFIEEQEK